MLVSLRRPRAAVHFEPDVFLYADDRKSVENSEPADAVTPYLSQVC